MQPYILTVKPKCPNCRHHDGEGECLCLDAEFYRAVATLDEAREAAHKVCVSTGYGPAETLCAVRARQLPDEGGTVGPLPDGTVVEVERIDHETLLRALPGPVRAGMWAQRLIPIGTAELCDAYNDAQESLG